MGLEKIKKSLVILDHSLDTLEEVIRKREQTHAQQHDALANQIDMFTQQNSASPNDNIDRAETVQKLDQIINQISGILEA